MERRMKNPGAVITDAAAALHALIKAVYTAGVPRETIEPVRQWVSQINGCSACVDSGARSARILVPTRCGRTSSSISPRRNVRGWCCGSPRPTSSTGST
jgi:hypothetical protein